jgi:hypothetical protein
MFVNITNRSIIHLSKAHVSQNIMYVSKTLSMCPEILCICPEPYRRIIQIQVAFTTISETDTFRNHTIADSGSFQD